MHLDDMPDGGMHVARNRRRGTMNRITRAIFACGTAVLAAGFVGASAETFPLECAQRDVQLVTQMEQHGEAQDVPGEILDDEARPRGLLPGPDHRGARALRQHFPPVAGRPDADAMTTMDSTHPANAGIDAAALLRDASVNVGRSPLARFATRSLRRLVQALHDSRRLESERVLARYRYLNDQVE
jgi:hypothetical protein